MLKIDCNCNSVYMLATIDHISKAIQDYHHRISPFEFCYLVVDNAGDYETKDAIEKFV